MRSIIFQLFIIVLFSFSKSLFSQEPEMDLDRVYGLDQTLCNGKKYNYAPPPGSKGNQFLLSPVYAAGSVTLKGKCYQDAILNYDILNQQLLLQYADEKGALNIIEVSKAWLKGFRLGNMNFELFGPEKNPGYYQVLGEGSLRIFYFWRKTLNLNDVINSTNFVFSSALRDSYVLMNGQLKPFRTKRSLIKLFETEHRPEIKNYLRKNKIKVRKTSDKAMAEMIIFIGNIK